MHNIKEIIANRAGQEEFIWAMNLRNHLDEDNSNTSWKFRKSKLQLYQSAEAKGAFKDIDKTKCLSMFTPKEIVENPIELNGRVHMSCVLLGQIGGLVDLNQLYLDLGRDLKTLSQILNGYLGSIIQELICGGGDVLYFTGTQFLAIWKEESNEDIFDTIHKALDSAFIIQKLYGDYPSDTGICISVRMMVSVGDVTFGIFGNDSFKKVVAFGEAITEVIKTIPSAKSGEIIAAFSAWKHINPDDYNFSVTDSGYIKVSDFSQNWKNTKNAFLREYIKKDALETDALNFRPLNVMLKSSKMSLASSNSANSGAFSYSGPVTSSWEDHPLYCYILPPIRNCIQANEQFNVLSERRMNISLTIRAKLNHVNVENINTVLKDVFKIGLIMEGIMKNIFITENNVNVIMVFGLKGFTHDYESQRGLKCATYCIKALKNIDVVEESCIIVTTELAYNGIVGYALRKEFVILNPKLTKSLTFASLYKNKIICDKDTFIHSKLDAQQFIVLEPTKDSAAFGSVYEYDEQIGLSSIGKPYKKVFPILDHDHELNKFLELLDAKMQGETGGKKAIVILGNARQGKSRLSEEFMYVTPSTLPTFRIELVQNDKLIPYQAIYKLFAIPLGFNEHTDHVDRQAKLVSKLRHVRVSELNCALNRVFKVNFVMTKTYTLLSTEQQQIVISKMLFQLAHAMAVPVYPKYAPSGGKELRIGKLWVIIIDNGEFIDLKSWPLISDLINTQSVLMTVAISNDKTFSSPAKNFINQPFVHVLRLKPMRKYYQIGLACQLLEVIGIPWELERLLHEKSNGSPGWIENFLRTMVADNSLKILNITNKHLKNYDLLIVPLEMVNRSPVAKEFLGAVDYKTISGRFITLNDKWAIYKDTFIDSKIMYDTNFQEMKKPTATGWVKVSLLTIEDFEMESDLTVSSDDSEKVKGIVKRICLIENMEALEKIGKEMTLDTYMLKLCDSLNSFQQQIIQCSSVIGDKFTRNILLYILGFPDAKKFSCGIKKLFELGVFDCASKQYVDGNISYVVDPPRLNTLEHETLVCYCRENKREIPPFPKYALCQNMYFKIHMIRQKTYEMIPPSERKMHHYKCILYLEKYTRQCNACGQGFFKNIHNCSSPRQVSTDNIDGTSKTKVVSSAASVYIESKRTGRRKSSISGNRSKTDIRLSILNSYMKSEGNQHCQCLRILAESYTQVEEHALAIEYMMKWILTTLEHAQISIDLYNLPLALHLLDTALIILEVKPLKIMQTKEVWNIPYIKGKIYTLMGRAQYDLGETKTAFKTFESALKFFDFNFPKKTSMAHTMATMQHHLMLSCCSHYGVGTKQGYLAEYADNVSNCLSKICQLFMDLNLIDNAEIAALWSLKKALQSEQDLTVLIIAFCNMIKVLTLKKKPKFIKVLEQRALSYCRNRKLTVLSLDLYVIATLYTVLFESRVISCKFDEANETGDVLFKLNSRLPLKCKHQEIYAVYVHTLLIKKKINEAAKFLGELQTLQNSQQYYDLSWYHALSLCFHLETGYSFEPETIANLEEISDTLQDFSARKRYQVCLWLWYLRHQDYGSAEKLKNEVKQTWSFSQHDPLADMITAMYYLECLLLDYAKAVNAKEYVDLEGRQSKIKSVISLLTNYASYQKILLPRLNLLKGFHHCLQGERRAGFSYLDRGFKIARKTDNSLDQDWIYHNEMVWHNNMPSINVHFWREHSEKLSYGLEDFNIMYYSFELPGFT